MSPLYRTITPRLQTRGVEAPLVSCEIRVIPVCFHVLSSDRRFEGSALDMRSNVVRTASCTLLSDAFADVVRRRRSAAEVRPLYRHRMSMAEQARITIPFQPLKLVSTICISHNCYIRFVRFHWNRMSLGEST